jgi:hypothetical protein
VIDIGVLVEYGAPTPVLLSVAVTVKLNVPNAVGVPLKTPLAAMLNPCGTLPAVIV